MWLHQITAGIGLVILNNAYWLTQDASSLVRENSQSNYLLGFSYYLK